MAVIRVSKKLYPVMLEKLAEAKEQEKKAARARKYWKIAAKYWNDNADLIESKMDSAPDSFKWNQLVNQEIFMWARIAEPVLRKDFRHLCKVRGFDASQTLFLSNFLKKAGLRTW